MKLPIYIKVLDIRRMRWALKLKYKFIKISDKVWIFNAVSWPC